MTRMRSLWLAIALVACGDVQKVPDAAIPDAYVPDTPEMVTCGTGEMNCNGNCANVMSSELYCGNCNTQCSPTQGCLNGSCVPANTTCARVMELDPAATDGGYRNPNTGVSFYCNFTSRRQYEFGLGQHNAGYAGFSPMTVASFDDATKTAFIGLYNSVSGVQTIAAFTSNTCCITQPNTNELAFGAPPNYLSLSLNGANQCNITYNGTYQIMKGQSASGILPLPLPADFFAGNPITEHATCGDSINIGLFMKATAF